MKYSLKDIHDKIFTSNASKNSHTILVAKKVPEFLSNGNVLDVEAWQGRNSIFLAQNGFSVTDLYI
ncbi:hypothetical protein HQ403_01240 [Candidatus Kaiserbacteria bacterium]|nr:hypothetical protein [Candidatus Kaiserbacteria bacterium]